MSRHFIYVVCILTLLLPTLIASGGGGGGGGGSRSGGGGGYRGGGGGGGGRAAVDVVYQLGQQVYQNRVQLGSFEADQFNRHIRGLEQAATWASQENNQRAPNFYRLAGYLNDKQYDGLRRFLQQRHKVDIAERSPDPSYARAVRWLLQPGTSVDMTIPLTNSRKKRLSRQQRQELQLQQEQLQKENAKKRQLADADLQTESDQAIIRQANNRLNLDVLTDLLPVIRRGYGGANAITYATEDFPLFYATIPDEVSHSLRTYVQQRFDVTIKALKGQQAQRYTRASSFIYAEIEPKLSGTVTITERERRQQRTFLRKLERALPRGSAKVSRWAGKLTPDDWLAVRTYAELRFGLVPEQ